ncbi:MAG: hypothetical protein ACLQSR_05135 [Limisphaerales bacterium]
MTKTRIVLALGIAVFTDGLQLLLGLLGPIGYFADDVTDVIAMLLTSWVLGFHWLLLPTFVLKLVPLADDLPTWTACVAAVIVLRKREQRAATPMPPEKPTIEM